MFPDDDGAACLFSVNANKMVWTLRMVNGKN